MAEIYDGRQNQHFPLISAALVIHPNYSVKVDLLNNLMKEMSLMIKRLSAVFTFVLTNIQYARKLSTSSSTSIPFLDPTAYLMEARNSEAENFSSSSYVATPINWLMSMTRGVASCASDYKRF